MTENMNVVVDGIEYNIQLLPIDVSWARVTNVGLLPYQDKSPSFEEWEADGKRFRQLDRMLPWLMGDWLNYGEKKWGDTYTQAMDEWGYSMSRLATCAWVCRQIPFYRRRQELSFGHHEIVASLDPKLQDGWLHMAIDNGYSILDLKDKIAGRPIISDGEVYWYVRLKDFLARIQKETPALKERLAGIVDFDGLDALIADLEKNRGEIHE